jgi:NAD+ diphosphatase
LREVGATLDDRDAGLAVHAVGLDNWHATHLRCPRCGAPTRPTLGGHVRRCDEDGSQHFPRTDPAVIMLVHDGADRCLLGRQTPWPNRRFSTLAGFVEPGESAEQAVAREVDEEVGLPVTDIEYRASQPWPFPSSLMFGYRARATAYDVDLRDGEIEEARWFSRAELRRAADAGEVVLSSPVSIAYRLITDWLTGR